MAQLVEDVGLTQLHTHLCCVTVSTVSPPSVLLLLHCTMYRLDQWSPTVPAWGQIYYFTKAKGPQSIPWGRFSGLCHSICATCVLQREQKPTTRHSRSSANLSGSYASFHKAPGAGGMWTCTEASQGKEWLVHAADLVNSLLGTIGSWHK